MSYRIGTSGYSYKDWEGVFYPPDIPKGKKLDYYAQHFNTVEINSTYYRIPNPAVFYHLHQKTAPDFEFIVKTNRESTHNRKENAKAMRELQEAVKPLKESAKLKGYLAQFPYSFKNIPTNRDYILQTKELTGEIPLFVEFRNWTWNQDQLADFLGENDINYVNVDQPPLRGLLPRQDLLTGNLGYVRFHGRNIKNWWEGTNESRYNYLYSEEELQEWIHHLVRLIKRSYRTYIFFNNHPQGQAIKNAGMLKKILEKQLQIFSE